jgi:hypothetical protein
MRRWLTPSLWEKRTMMLLESPLTMYEKRMLLSSLPTMWWRTKMLLLSLSLAVFS